MWLLGIIRYQCRAIQEQFVGRPLAYTWPRHNANMLADVKVFLKGKNFNVCYIILRDGVVKRSKVPQRCTCVHAKILLKQLTYVFFKLMVGTAKFGKSYYNVHLHLTYMSNVDLRCMDIYITCITILQFV